jgi:hypothetical protein
MLTVWVRPADEDGASERDTSDMPKTTTKDKAPKKAPSAARGSKKNIEAKAKAAKPAVPDDVAKRQLSPRGAAPWISRHAAKHKAEHLARVAVPPPPGSARSTLRKPEGADALKTKVTDLYNLMARIKTLLKRLDRNFFDVGVTLLDIQAQELHLAKGYGSFEAFLDRERDLGGKAVNLKLMRVAQIFQREAALDYGMERLFSALVALDGELGSPKPAPSNAPTLPLKPPIRVVG